jgi:hypothetical protein
VPAETQAGVVIGPEAGLVRAAVTHEVRCLDDGVDCVLRDGASNTSHQGKQSAHPARNLLALTATER